MTRGRSQTQISSCLWKLAMMYIMALRCDRSRGENKSERSGRVTLNW